MLRLILVVLSIFCVPFVINLRLRDKILPVAFAYSIAWAFCSSVMPSYALMKFGDMILFICCGIIVYGFKPIKHSPHKIFASFSIFASYYIISCVWGNFAVENMVSLLSWYLEMICVGYFMAKWSMEKEGRFQKILAWGTIACIPVVYVYTRNNVLEMSSAAEHMRIQIELDDTGDRLSSINGLAIEMCALLAYPFLHILFYRFFAKRILRSTWNLIVIGVAIVCILILSIYMIRTGCRNAMLGAFVYPIYAIFGKWNRDGSAKLLFKKIVFITFVVVAGVIVGSRYFGKGYEFRSFDFFAKSDTTSRGDITTGRTHIYKEFLNSMSPANYLIGAGAVPKEYRGTYGTGGFSTLSAYVHNSYLQLFVQSGFIGIVLFLIFVIKFFKNSRRQSVEIRHLIYLLFFMWFLTGVAESQGFIFMSKVMKYNFAMGIAFSDGAYSLPFRFKMRNKNDDI